MYECSVKTFLILLLVIWFIVYLLDAFLRHYKRDLYARLLDAGWHTSPGQLRVTWTDLAQRSSDGLIPFVSARRPWLQAWFSIGVLASLVAMVAMFYFLGKLFATQVTSTYALFTSSPSRVTHAASSPRAPQLIAVIPGVTLPLAHLPIFFTVLILAAVFHELGHILAGLLEGAALTGFGVFVFILYPGAMTNFDTASLDVLTPSRKLKIFAGGIWHNFVLAIAAMLLWTLCGFCVNPLIYRDISGVEIVGHNLPGLTGENGLKPGARVTAVNSCPVSNKDDWKQCLSALNSPLTVHGNCVSRKKFMARTHFERKAIRGEIECCPASEAASNICFYTSDFSAFSCLQARYVTSQPHCGNTSNSQFLTNSQFGKYSKFTVTACPTDNICAFPALFNETRLMRFALDRGGANALSANQTRDVLFIGQPDDILNLVTVTSSVPRNQLLSVISNMGSLTAQYTVMFSMAFGLLNAVPCFGLDGFYIVLVLAEFAPKWFRNKANSIAHLLVVVGSFLILSQTMNALVNVFGSVT